MLERLQKILSSQGVASRRKAEEYIERGLVTVNGKVAKLGDKADPEQDRIEVDGKVLSERAEMLYYVMNKPVGAETSNVERSQKPEARSQGKKQGRTVREILPADLQGKVFPVGRLDKDSSGLLLFTNDGVLAYRLTHPKFDHDKEYEVTLDRPISPSHWRALEEGIVLDGSKTKPLTVKKAAPRVLRITLTEGRNRQIRRMLQHVGYTVKSLKRVRIMTLADESLPEGALRALTQAEKVALLESVGV